MLKVLYFAWVREKAGIAAEEVPVPDGGTVADLVAWQRGRGDGFADAFADDATIRVAVNQTHVGLEHALADGDEVAFFPPVTGG